MTTPIKGTVWTHARRREYSGEPATFTVTSVSAGLVYSRDRLGRRIKTPATLWEKMCGSVVSVPEKVAPVRSPKLTPTQCRALHQKAHVSGMSAGAAAMPVPMIVVQHRYPLDDTSPVVKTYPPVMDGPCGFATVSVRPGNSAFARWLKAHGGYAGYRGGVDLFVGEFNQSVTRKAAYAQAYAGVLTEAGILASVSSRLD